MSSHFVSRRSWLLLLLMGVIGALFYLDRYTFSVLKTTLKGIFGWNDVDYGWLVTAFMSCYMVCYLGTGRLVDHWGTRRTMPAFVGIMSVATILSGLARNFGEMGAFRALLGVAEAGVMPAIMVAVFQWFPRELRGTAATLKEPIYVAGQVLAAPLAVGVMQLWSWRMAFVIPGVLGLFMAVAWWLADRPPPEREAPKMNPESFRVVLQRREIWGVLLARLITDPLWFFFFHWEPGYLQERMGMSLGLLAKVGWIPTAFATVVLLGLGMASDWTITHRGWAPTRSRRLVLQSTAILGPLVLLLPFVQNVALVIFLLCLVRAMMVVWLNFTSLYLAELVPMGSIGTTAAIMSALGVATGLICNTLVGPVVESVGYGVIFAVGACLHPIGAVVLWRFYGLRERNTR